MFLIMLLFPASWHLLSLESKHSQRPVVGLPLLQCEHDSERQPRFANIFKKFSHTSQVSISQQRSYGTGASQAQ